MSSRANEYDSTRRRRSRSTSRDRSHRHDRDRHRSRSRSRDRRDRDRNVDDRRRDRQTDHRRSRSRSPVRRRSRPRSKSLDKKDKHRDRSRDRYIRRSRSRSASVSSSSPSESDHKKHKRKKDKKRKRSRSRERKERKKEKKEKKKKKSVAASHQWGKYGIINETDLYNKEPEFRAWLVEERVINPETITKDQTKKEFAKFVEDYNTATLPNEKFYNMESYERRMAALRSGEYLPPTDDLSGSSYDPFADLRALQSASSSKRKKAQEDETFMNREQLMELRKVQAERVEAGKMKLLGMDIKQNMGVRMDGSSFE